MIPPQSDAALHAASAKARVAYPGQPCEHPAKYVFGTTAEYVQGGNGDAINGVVVAMITKTYSLSTLDLRGV